MTKKEIDAVLAAHKNWRTGQGGKRADLISANLINANLRGALLDGARLDGADLISANLINANLRGADLISANLRGADLRGAYLSGARLDGANLTSALLDGARLDGANLTSANLTGAVIGGETIVGLPRRATRSDGYEFFLWRCESDYFVRAGCRWLSFSAARKHWRSNTWRKDNDPDLYHESLDILAFFERHIKRERLSTPKESEATASKES